MTQIEVVFLGKTFSAHTLEQIFIDLEDFLLKESLLPECLSVLRVHSHFKEIATALEAIGDLIYSTPGISAEDQERLSEKFSYLCGILEPKEAKILSTKVNSLPSKHRKLLGLIPQESDAIRMVVDYGNHRAAAAIIMYYKGELEASTIIGEKRFIDCSIEPLTVGELIVAFQNETLHTNNKDTRGRPWIDFFKVDAIIRDFDIDLFFETERKLDSDNVKGIILIQLPEDRHPAKYVDIIGYYNPNKRFSSYLYEKIGADRGFDMSLTVDIAATNHCTAQMRCNL